MDRFFSTSATSILILITATSSTPPFLGDNFFQGFPLHFIAHFSAMTTYQKHVFLHIVSSNPFSPRVLDHIENSVISNNSSPIYPFHSRFETRLATFILPQDKKYLNLASQAHQLLNVLRTIISSNEDPTYIFINIFYTTLLSHFPPDIALTSKFLILQEAKPFHVMILCHPCRPSRYVPIPNLTKLAELSALWRKYNWNLRGSILSQSAHLPFKNAPFLPDQCMTPTKSYSFTRSTCTKEVIAKRYNFSNYIYPRDLRGRTLLPTVNVMIVLTPIFDMLADKTFNQNVFRPRSPHKNAWYVHGTHYLPFLFVVIAPKVEVSFETIAAPFDSATWVLILVASGSMVILLTLLTTRFSNNFSNAVFSTISTIFGQTDSVSLPPSGRNRILLPALVLLWGEVTFLLGNFHQGAVFSCMTATLSPTVPNGLYTLLDETDWDFVTMTAVVGRRDYGAIGSILQHSVLPDLVTSGNKMWQKSFPKLHRRTKFLPGNKFATGYNISHGLDVLSTNGDLVKVKPPLVLLDVREEVDLLVEGAAFFARDLVVLRNHGETPFISRVPWISRRNFFYPLFANGLGRLVQSGIYGYWNKLGEGADQVSQAGEFLRGANFKLFRTKALTKVEREVTFSEANPVSWDVMKEAVALCVMGGLMGLTCFGVELFSKIGKKCGMEQQVKDEMSTGYLP
ncbi:hypothetical protein Fcan01_27824 [Folsomia candida]|uniref:Uncharacterized protein n=1 Tax=Folsomia candida TaxID=158441 RepID=A0A226CXY4_FOLCA|nr:hypothetical protein Fcan01_27824 [Folsomia candida]